MYTLKNGRQPTESQPSHVVSHQVIIISYFFFAFSARNRSTRQPALTPGFDCVAALHSGRPCLAPTSAVLLALVINMRKRKVNGEGDRSSQSELRPVGSFRSSGAPTKKNGEAHCSSERIVP